MRRALAFTVSLGMIVLVPGWLLAMIFGVGSFEPVPENDGCWQPQFPYGIALLVVGVAGHVSACWTLRYAIAETRGADDTLRYLWGVGVTAMLLAAFVLITVPLNPDGVFGRC
jgi:hypothetical protein